MATEKHTENGIRKTKIRQNAGNFLKISRKKIAQKCLQDGIPNFGWRTAAGLKPLAAARPLRLSNFQQVLWKF